MLEALLADVESGRLTLREDVRSRLQESIGVLSPVVKQHDLLIRILAAGPFGKGVTPTVTARSKPTATGQRVTKASAEVPKTRHVGRPRILEVHVIERIVKMRQDGMTIAAIAADLSRSGIPTAKGGNVWSPGTIQTVLASRTARSMYTEP